MKLYETKDKNIINLENVTMIYKSPGEDTYKVATISGYIYELLPDTFNETDIQRIMNYNDYFIDD